RTYARRIEALQDAEHGFDFLDTGAKLFRRRRQVGAQISGLVDQIDQILADHTPRRLGNGDSKLLTQPVRKRGLGGNVSFKIVVALRASAADRSPLRISGRTLGTTQTIRIG